jgi:thiamine-monophosphate kinase
MKKYWMKAGEDELVQGITSALAFKSSRRLDLGVGDDAALLDSSPNSETILSCDWFLEGRHFLFRSHPPDSVGWKCLARALSDIAAMGGQPRCFLLSLALPKSVTYNEKGEPAGWLDGFLRGLRRAAMRFECPLAGGDTTRARQILVSVTVVGQVQSGQAVRRSGAKPGDKVFVSGTLGLADLGLKILRRGSKASSKSDIALRKHLYPEPRLALGQWLARHRLASSMIDISDGLSSDLARLCAASRVGARIEVARMPSPKVLQADLQKSSDASSLALNGGDDYELLFTVPARHLARIPRSFQGIALTYIGEITRERRILVVGRDGTTKPLLLRGWDPFRK